MAAQIIASAAQKITLPVENEKVSVSIGVAIYQGIENNYSELFKKADIAMYEAKADQNNRFSIFE